jgi:Zn finger protein HypA/HybF involved in hydrogenase expression
MHELGIASSILDAVRAESARHGGARVCKVGVRIGEYSGVDTGSLSFCFEALVKADELAPLTLEIEYCPAANGSRGDELDFSYMEIEEPEEPDKAEPYPTGR